MTGREPGARRNVREPRPGFRLVSRWRPLERDNSQACRSRLNKALWFYLSFPKLFERATLFARAGSLTAGRFAISWRSS